MNDYLLVFRGGREEMQKLSPEELQRHMEIWRTWLSSLKGKGVFVAGQPLDAEGRVLSGSSPILVKDGPYAESKEAIGGYVIVNSESLNAAVEHAKFCPVLITGGTVEVRRIHEMMALE